MTKVEKGMVYKTDIALASQYHWDINQMHVTTACLQGGIYEDIYLEQPQVFGDDHANVCKLKKALDGLKQSLRMWQEKLQTTLDI